MNINLDSAKDTLCKNIAIYGYCKFENKGCAFSHTRPGLVPPRTATPNGSGTTTTSPALANTKTETKKKFNFNTPSFQPSGPTKFSPKLDSVASFIPNNSSSPDLNIIKSEISAPNSANGTKKFNMSANSFTPIGLDSAPANPYTGTPSMNHVSMDSNMQSPIQTPMSMQSASTGNMSKGSSDLYFQNAPSTTNYPLNYHLYAPKPPPRLSIPLPPYETNANDMFIPNDLRESLTKKNEATLLSMGRSNLPENVNVYHSLIPLDMETKSKVWNTHSAVYKVFSNVDGNPYILRKINTEGITVVDTDSFKTIKRWKSINNSNIVKLQDCFTTIAFDGLNSKLVMIYDYYPNSITLLECHINRRLGYKLEPLTEPILWGYIVQITNALLAIHENGLAARSSLDLTKIIVTNKNRIKLSSAAVSDILNNEADKAGTLRDIMNKEQKEDLKQFGLLIAELAMVITPSNTKLNTIEEKLKYLPDYVSKEMMEVISKLVNDYEYVNLEKFNQFYLARHALEMVNNLQDSNEFAEAQLGSELENARLFRLISKLNFIIDHPTINWRENEKVFLIKLFNDFVFHQLDEMNKPVIDLSRVLTKLNKLDVGIDERFMLISRDEKLSILVSYKEVRDIIDSVFRELTK